MFLPRLSLRLRVALAALLLFVCSIWLLTYIATSRLEQGLEQVLANQQFSYVTQASSEIEGKVQARFNALQTIANEITPALLAAPEQLRAHLANRPLLTSYFGAGTVVVGHDGIGITDYPVIPGREHASFQDLDFFIETMQTGKATIGKARSGRFTGAQFVTFAVPIRIQGEIAAILTGHSRLDDQTLFGSFLVRGIGQSGWIAISDVRHRMIIAINDPKRLLQPFPQPGVNQMLDRFVAGYEGSGISLNSQGREVLSSAKHVGDTGWMVQAVLPTEEAFAPVHQMASQNYRIAALLSAVAALLAWLVIRHLLSPLGQASQTIRQMTQGELPVSPLQIARQDEIGELLNAFNHLFSQRQQSEAILRNNEQLLNEAQRIGRMGSYDYDITRDYWTNSSAFDEIFGIDAAYPRNFSGWQALIHPEEREATAAAVRHALDGTGEYFSHEYRIIRQDDRQVSWVQGTGRVERNPEGQAIRMVGTIQDITQHKEIEHRLRLAVEQAEAANLAKSRFLATMSHEIRTPMNGILGMAQMLLSPGTSPEEQRDYARTILSSGQTLLALLNDILDLSKIEAGKLELAPAAFSPPQLLDEIAQLFASPAHEKQLQLILDWQDTADLMLVADPVRLRQMLSNLTSNAIKFTQQGEVRITGRLLTRQETTACLEFSVSDTGVGIPDEKLAQLFSPFTQADSSITRQYGGTGLGLSIVRNLARAMSGEAGIESRLGHGTRCWFRVQAEILPTGSERRRQARSPASPTADKLPQARILLVDDNAINRKVASALLHSLGMDVSCAENGEQAIELACKTNPAPALILMDVQMPVMDGIEATHHIREYERSHRRSPTPIVALTAGAYAEDREHCLEAGMDDFLTKPLKLSDLESVLRTHLKSSA